MPGMSSISAVAEAYGQSLQALVTLGEQLDEPDWSTPTQCPLWSVADIFAHIVGPEEWLAAGAPAYDAPTPRWIDSQVTARRGQTPATLLADLRAILPVRLKQLSQAHEQPTVFIPMLHADGPHELGLRFRVFDLWTHEQDVRVAVGRPGNLATDSARVAQQLLIGALPRGVAKVAAAPPGSTVRITMTGELPADVAVAVDENGRGALTGAGPADLHLAMKWEAFARLGAGRGAVADYEVSVDGDAELAQRVLAALNVAP
jgi:uncharacterized protein (TIGR03083 family)